MSEKVYFVRENARIVIHSVVIANSRREAVEKCKRLETEDSWSGDAVATSQPKAKLAQGLDQDVEAWRRIGQR